MKKNSLFMLSILTVTLSVFSVGSVRRALLFDTRIAYADASIIYTFDTVHFTPTLKAWPFQGDGVYLLLGKVTEEFGQPSLEVEKMARIGYKELQ